MEQTLSIINLHDIQQVSGGFEQRADLASAGSGDQGKVKGVVAKNPISSKALGTSARVGAVKKERRSQCKTRG